MTNVDYAKLLRIQIHEKKSKGVIGRSRFVPWEEDSTVSEWSSTIKLRDTVGPLY